jgi:hypothetical protein
MSSSSTPPSLSAARFNVSGAVAQRGMPTGWEALAGCEVAGEGLKEERWGAAEVKGKVYSADETRR